MLNIGTLDQVGTVYTTTMTTDTNTGQRLKTFSSPTTFYFRRLLRKNENTFNANARYTNTEFEIITRFNTIFKNNSVVSIYNNKNTSGDQEYYSVVGIEEIGRGVGLKIRIQRAEGIDQSNT